MSAFALGLLGRREAILPLRTALGDASPIVRGRAAEALGLIGDTEGAAAIGAMVGAYIKAGALASVVADESGHPLSPEIEATRLGLYALARLKAYDPLAAAVLDAKGAPVTRWWPVAYAFRRVGDPQGGAGPARARARRRHLHQGVCGARPRRGEGHGPRSSSSAAWRPTRQTRRLSASRPSARSPSSPTRAR